MFNKNEKKALYNHGKLKYILMGKKRRAYLSENSKFSWGELKFEI